METKPMASNESVAAELRRIVEKLQENAHDMESPYYTMTPTEPDWDYVAKAFKEIAAELEPLIARLEAPDLQEDVETILVQMETFASESVGTRACRDNVGEFARRLRAALAGQP